MIGQFVNYKFFHLEASEGSKRRNLLTAVSVSSILVRFQLVSFWAHFREVFSSQKRGSFASRTGSDPLSSRNCRLWVCLKVLFFSYHLFIISCLFMSYHLFVSNHASCMLHRNNVVEYLFYRIIIWYTFRSESGLSIHFIYILVCELGCSYLLACKLNLITRFSCIVWFVIALGLISFLIFVPLQGNCR